MHCYHFKSSFKNIGHAQSQFYVIGLKSWSLMFQDNVLSVLKCAGGNNNKLHILHLRNYKNLNLGICFKKLGITCKRPCGKLLLYIVAAIVDLKFT